MNIIYSKKHFNLYKVGRNSFIIHNINKEFKYGHTHINNYNTAKWIINLAFHKTMPKRANKYILNSLPQLKRFSKSKIEKLNITNIRKPEIKKEQKRITVS